MKWMAFGFILVGIGFIAFPYVENLLVTYHQNQFINQFEDKKMSQFPSSIHESYKEVNEILLDGPPSETVVAPSNDPYAIAMLEIPSIQLKLPVFQGATELNLQYGVGLMNNTAAIGEIGNAALAAHRGYRDGKLFNRLDQVKKGDHIIATTSNKQFTFEVVDTYLVTPEDVSVLSQPEKNSTLTLITCDPIPNPTHRLIVKAESI